MKTAVLMQRKLFDGIIHQNSKTEYLSATDLIKVGNKFRAINGLGLFDYRGWLKSKNVEEFIIELENTVGDKVWKPARGRGQHSWCHPYLFIDMALAINPKLKIEVYKWLYDYLLETRNDSGDSYRAMSGALYHNCGNKSKFGLYMKDVAKQIRFACGVNGEDEEAWQKATKDQLYHRNTIHELIRAFSRVLRNNDEAVRLGILQSQK